LLRRCFGSFYDTPERSIAIAVPALVSEELFAAVAEQLSENRRRQRQGNRGARHLLQGLVVCQRCGYAYYGKPVSRQAAKGRQRCYVYYRCTGTDAYRFGGQRVCDNKQLRSDLLEEAVWQDVCALLKDPGRLQTEFERRRDKGSSAEGDQGIRPLENLIQQLRRGIARLIDAYSEGLVEKGEFEPRVRGLRERLTRLESEVQEQIAREAEERDLCLVIGRLQEFAEKVKAGLEEADWATRRELIRTLVRRIEIEAEEVRVVYRVNLPPFVESPERGSLPDCGRGDFPLARQHRSELAGLAPHGELLRPLVLQRPQCVSRLGPLDTHAYPRHEVQAQITCGQLAAPGEAIPQAGL
jgi:site-specific DNA recombinase